MADALGYAGGGMAIWLATPTTSEVRGLRAAPILAGRRPLKHRAGAHAVPPVARLPTSSGAQVASGGIDFATVVGLVDGRQVHVAGTRDEAAAAAARVTGRAMTGPRGRSPHCAASPTGQERASHGSPPWHPPCGVSGVGHRVPRLDGRHRRPVGVGEDLPSHLFGALEGETYVYNAYLLTLSVLLVIAGALADAYGRRRMFAVGLVGFGVTSEGYPRKVGPAGP